MALPNLTTWEVRTTGTDTNGGGYLPGASGTDYSQQNAAQLSNTDLVLVTTTTCSSAGSPFTSAHIGNVLQITAGSGFTTGFYYVSAVALGIATLDRVAGTISSTGGTFALGGALATPSKLVAAIVSGGGNSFGMYAYLKAGTYTQTVETVFTGLVQNLVIEGYQTTRGDLGTRPLITTATNSTKLFTYGSSTTIYGVRFRNVSFSNTAAVRAIGFYASTGGGVGGLQFEKCLLDGFTEGINGGFDGSGTFYFNMLVVYRTEIKNCSSYGIHNAGNTNIIASYIHDNGSYGMYCDAAPGVASSLNAQSSIFDTNGASGIYCHVGAVGFSYVIKNCDFYNNTGAGVLINTAQQHPGVIIEGCIFEANSTYGINNSESSGYADLAWFISGQNAFFNNTTAATNGWYADPTNITLTGSPFTNAGSGDFSLNNTAGAGASCKGVGVDASSI